MALIEAQAAGLPVIAGRSGGVASVVTDGETGLLVPEGDAAAFSKPSAYCSPIRCAARRWAGGMEHAERDNDIAGAAALLDAQLRRLTADLPLLVIRHGPTDWNEAGLIQGHTDRPLSDAGREQVGSLRLPVEWRAANAFEPAQARRGDGDPPRPRPAAGAAAHRDGVGRMGRTEPR